nr:unnamed protein product [Callosobruchus analis]
MHLVLLGVTKRMLTLWLKGGKNIRFSNPQIEKFEKLHLDCVKYLPNDFARKPRSLLAIERWKATEFRLFLLYTGPVVLKSVISGKVYNHFLSLVVSIRLLCEKNQNISNVNYAQQLLVYFVQKFPYIFGTEYVTYNVHNLIHLAEDVKTHGSLDSFSAFQFENHMFEIKKQLKSSRLPLQQLHNRIKERMDMRHIDKVKVFPIITFKDHCIFSVETANFVLSLKSNENSCLLRDGRVLVVNKFTTNNGLIYLSGKILQKSMLIYSKHPANLRMF